MKKLRFGFAALALAILASCDSSETTETETAADTMMPAGTNDMGTGTGDMGTMDTTMTGTNTTNNGTGTGTTGGGTTGTDTMMSR